MSFKIWIASPPSRINSNFSSFDIYEPTHTPSSTPLVLANPIQTSITSMSPTDKLHCMSTLYSAWDMRIYPWGIVHEVFVDCQSDHHWAISHEFLHYVIIGCLNFEGSMLAIMLFIWLSWAIAVVLTGVISLISYAIFWNNSVRYQILKSCRKKPSRASIVVVSTPN